MLMKWLCRISEWLAGLAVLFILYVNVKYGQRHYYLYSNGCAVPNRVYVGCFLVAAVFCIILGYFLEKRNRLKTAPADALPGTEFMYSRPEGLMQLRKVLIHVGIFLFVVQIWYADIVWFETGWDVHEVLTMAHSLAFEGGRIGDAHYFSMYPNNVFITGLFAGIWKIAALFGPVEDCFPLIVAGCLLVNLTGWFMADSVRMLTGHWVPVVLSYVLFVILFGVSHWITIPYSDTYSILFPTLAVWIFLRRSKKHLLGSWFAIAAISLTGMLIKPTVVMTLGILSFFAGTQFFAVWKKHDRADSLRMLSKYLAGITLGLVLALALRTGMRAAVGYEPDETRRFTMTHYLMMGLNRKYTGGYNQEDVNLSIGYGSVEERVRENLKEVNRRIEGMDPLTLKLFYYSKMLNNFNDGTFGWGHEGAFYWAFRQAESGFADYIRSYIYHEGSRHGRYVAFMQGVWILVLCCCAMLLLPGFRKKKDPAYTAVTICMLAIFTFVMVFEARARYLYCYGPLILMTAVIALGRLVALGGRLWKKIRKEK